MSTIADYLINDDYRPPIPKAHLQQYDNYQIHHLYCVDIICQRTSGPPGDTDDLIFQSFIAVQAYDITNIECDFDEIIQAYP